MQETCNGRGWIIEYENNGHGQLEPRSKAPCPGCPRCGRMVSTDAVREPHAREEEA